MHLRSGAYALPAYLICQRPSPISAKLSFPDMHVVSDLGFWLCLLVFRDGRDPLWVPLSAEANYKFTYLSPTLSGTL